MDEVISQDIEGVGDNVKCAENGKGYQEVGRKANTTIMEVEGSILTASINNRTTNATNIAQILENL